MAARDTLVAVAPDWALRYGSAQNIGFVRQVCFSVIAAGVNRGVRCTLTSATRPLKQSYDFFQAPNMVCNSRLHCWRHAQTLVNPGKIVMHIVKGNRGFVVFKLRSPSLLLRPASWMKKRSLCALRKTPPPGVRISALLWQSPSGR